ncbi:unnamed protein product [Meganyctiphanes norvegica]|uniref:Uncharacterized protein n=1 Tax=Meganyctiphanes norvegica TaxID=48144 RepID=A0AAV2S8W1_MEGNR
MSALHHLCRRWSSDSSWWSPLALRSNINLRCRLSFGYLPTSGHHPYAKSSCSGALYTGFVRTDNNIQSVALPGRIDAWYGSPCAGLHCSFLDHRFSSCPHLCLSSLQ